VYILDTNTLIYFFKGIGNVSKNLLSKSPKEIAIPSLVIYELEYGIAKSISPSKRMKQLNQMCSLIEVLPFAEDEAKEAALIRVDLEKKGTPIGHYDILIAGTVLHYNGTLITNNTNEFKRIPKLKIANWL
jgi:tRNA(fMet)-specific endonuclease VapC